MTNVFDVETHHPLVQIFDALTKLNNILLNNDMQPICGVALKNDIEMEKLRYLGLSDPLLFTVASNSTGYFLINGVNFTVAKP